VGPPRGEPAERAGDGEQPGPVLGVGEGRVDPDHGVQRLDPGDRGQRRAPGVGPLEHDEGGGGVGAPDQGVGGELDPGPEVVGDGAGAGEGGGHVGGHRDRPREAGDPHRAVVEVHDHRVVGDHAEPGPVGGVGQGRLAHAGVAEHDHRPPVDQERGAVEEVAPVVREEAGQADQDDEPVGPGREVPGSSDHELGGGPPGPQVAGGAQPHGVVVGRAPLRQLGGLDVGIGGRELDRRGHDPQGAVGWGVDDRRVAEQRRNGLGPGVVVGVHGEGQARHVDHRPGPDGGGVGFGAHARPTRARRGIGRMVPAHSGDVNRC